MDKEQIIQMARNAELIYAPEFCMGFDPLPRHIEAIERFAAAIRAATKEEDAKICEFEHLSEPQDREDYAYDEAVNDCASAIRASK